MPVLNAQPVDHGAMSVFGGKIDPVSRYQQTGYLRAVPADAEFGPGTDPAVRKLIATHHALGTLAEPDRRVLLRWSKFRNMKRREVVCRQSDPAGSVILVLEGYLKLSTILADGSEVLLEIIGPGECAGEVSALQTRPHDADLTALSRCRLLVLDARQFRQAFERQPEGLLAILRTAAERLQRATEQLIDSRALPAPARLAKALLLLARLPATGSRGEACLPLRLSQSELGAMTGVCREVVNKHLGVWRDAGWIQMSGGAAVHIDAAAMSDVLQS